MTPRYRSRTSIADGELRRGRVLSWALRPQEYIHRVGRTARGINGRGHALLILRPEELGFLRFLKQAKVTWSPALMSSFTQQAA